MGSASETLRLPDPGDQRGGTPAIREASLEDYQQIARLESRYGLEARSYEEWSHLWLNNPLFHELQPGWTIGWVLEDANKQIVASVSNIPLCYEFRGNRILAATGRAQVAEPQYRSASMLLLDRLINQRNIDLYLNSTMTAEAAPSFSAFECPRVPVGVWDESAFWITHYPGFFESLLARKKYPLARLLSFPLTAVASFKDKVASPTLHDNDVEVTVCPGFDDRFDEFWTGLRSRNPHLLLAVRTREVLEWHFRYALRNNRLWIAAVVDGPRLAAYAIFDRKDNPRIGLKRTRLVDFQSLDGSTTLLAPLLWWAVRECRNKGIHTLENTGRWLEKDELVASVAPYRRKLSTWTYFYRAYNPGLTKGLTDRRAWAPSLFDGNASL
jgi:hypothetical protein